MIIAFIVTMIFAAPLLAAAYTDLSSMRIPNILSLLMFAGFVVTLPLTWQGLDAFSGHLIVGLSFFLAGFAMFAFGWIGGGDAKLMAGTAFWLAPMDVIPFIMNTTLVGAAIALFLLFSKQFAPVRFRTSTLGMMIYQGESDMPYGLAIAAGAMLAWPGSQIGMALLAI